jgi:hypothetical protein
MTKLFIFAIGIVIGALVRNRMWLKKLKRMAAFYRGIGDKETARILLHEIKIHGGRL